METLYTVASERHGILDVVRTFGTLVESGGEVENVYVRLALYRNGQAVRLETYELEGLDVARARFEELRAETAA